MKNELSDLEQLKAMIKDVKFTMMTTVNADGSIHSRPMATLDVSQFAGKLWFFSRKSSLKNHQIKNDQHVNLGYADPNKHHYVSICGRANISTDKEMMKACWNPALKTWFSEGLNDPELSLIEVSVESAEVWDSSRHLIADLASFVKGTLTGKTNEIKDFAQHFKFETPKEDYVMSAEEKLDETIDESFPASDPPGHFAKSEEDLKHY